MAKNSPEIGHAYIEKNLNEIGSLPEMIFFTMKDFLFWWYIQMPQKIAQSIVRILVYVDDQFSISLLFSTFLIPWKRDMTAVGYFMGIIVRIIYLPLSLIIYLVTLILSFFTFLFWVLLPPVTIFFIIATPLLNI